VLETSIEDVGVRLRFRYMDVCVEDRRRGRLPFGFVLLCGGECGCHSQKMQSQLQAAEPEVDVLCCGSSWVVVSRC